jgi:salicylate hydroxylase
MEQSMHATPSERPHQSFLDIEAQTYSTPACKAVRTLQRAKSCRSGAETILVVGAGPGGLSAAIALGQKGRRVRVLERDAEFRAAGYGIQLGPNAFAMLKRLDLLDAVLAECHRPSCLLMRDSRTGQEIVRLPTGGEFEERYGFPYAVVHRADLHRVLVGAARQLDLIELQTNTTVTTFQEFSGKVRIASEDGRAIDGAAIIGADGLRSRIRAQLLGEVEPRSTGCIAYRTVVPIARVPAAIRDDNMVLWAGPGFHLVHYPLRRGSLFNIVASFGVASPPFLGSDQALVVGRYLQGAHPDVLALFHLMDVQRSWPICDRDPLRHWSKGRVTLLGDAAHPALQSMAQGACMAIEDGVCIAEQIHASADDLPAAFRRYDALRCLRTARVQLMARHLWDHYHGADALRDQRRRELVGHSERDMHVAMAWLYDGMRGSRAETGVPDADPQALNIGL